LLTKQSEDHQKVRIKKLSGKMSVDDTAEPMATSNRLEDDLKDEEEESLDFHQMGLDDRLLKAIAQMRWQEPTAIQEKAIPLVMEGRDVLARGRTGSGKTGAFALPAIQKVLSSKRLNSSSATSGGQVQQCVRVLVMAPTRELAKQIHEVFQALTSSCGRVVRSVDVAAAAAGLEATRPLLVGDVPDVVVGTPSRILAHLEAGHLDSIKKEGSLELLVMDEADLIVSFGYESDVKKVLGMIAKSSSGRGSVQAVLTSATLSEEVGKLKGLVLHNPVTLKLEEPSSLPEESQLTQYRIYVEEQDKFVLIYALFKLKLVRGKSIIFVNNVDRCYRLKLYLEQFDIPVCVLNSELPNSSRCHIVTQFNKGIYQVIVASDEKFLAAEDESALGGGKITDKDKSGGKRKRDAESGVSRGIDFQFVSNIINFDFPHDADSYVHRVGRTARGNNKGTALSLVAGKEKARAEAVEAVLRRGGSNDNEEDEDEDPKDGGGVFKPYKFRMEELEGFRYRALDAWRAVTRVAIREARLKEIKQEMINTTRLQSHFADNPRDLVSLRHDKALHTVKHQPHLKTVPNYIVPQSLRKLNAAAGGLATGGAGAKRKGGRGFKAKTSGGSAAKRKFTKQQGDALRSIAKK